MGFFEILLIAVVALLVVGPERMPEAVRTVALTVGRIKRSFDSAKSEIEKQVGADEIRRQLHNEAVMDNVNKIKGELSELDKNIDNIDSSERQTPWSDDDYNEEEEIEKYLLESHPEKATSKTENKNTPSV